MNEIEIFQHPDFGNIRTTKIDGDPWFVGKDVAEALGYSNSRKALADHVDEDDKGVTKCDTLGGMQEMTVINESGLYTLVFGSKLPEAKKFKHWVTSEVLPTIRKTGGYGLPKTLSEALYLAGDLAKKNEQLAIENQTLKPKAEFYDAVADSKTAIPMDQVAKVLAIPGIGRNKLFELLRNMNILQSNNIPYQAFIDRGYFRTIETKYTKPNGDTCINIKTLVYQKGVDYIRGKVSDLSEVSDL